MARKRSGGGPVIGEGIGYGGRAGRWTARVAAGRDRRPRRTPGRRAVEGRVRRRGATPLDTYKNNSARVYVTTDFLPHCSITLVQEATSS